MLNEDFNMNAEQLNQPHPAASAPVAVRAARPVKRKTRITIYLDDEVLANFRTLSEQSGKGYQTLINAALRTRLGVPRMDAALAE